MSKERGRRKNYSGRNHVVRELRKKGSFKAEAFMELNIEPVIPNVSETGIAEPKITNMEPGKEYPMS